jgi:hypothetical protein
MFATRMTDYFFISFEQIPLKLTVLWCVTSCIGEMKYPALDDPESSVNQKLTKNPITILLFHQPAVNTITW